MVLEEASRIPLRNIARNGGDAAANTHRWAGMLTPVVGGGWWVVGGRWWVVGGEWQGMGAGWKLVAGRSWWQYRVLILPLKISVVIWPLERREIAIGKGGELRHF